MATVATAYSGWGGGPGQYPVFRLRGQIERTAVSIPNNTSTVRVRFWVESTSGSFNMSSWHDLWINGSQVVAYNSNRALGNYSEVLVADDTVVITHNADGKKTVGAGLIFSNSIAGSHRLDFDLVLDNIPRATTPTWTGNFVPGEAAKTISLPRPTGTSFTHDVTWAFGSMSGTIATGATTSTTWAPNINLLSQIPNSATGTGTITTVTKNGGTTIGTTTKQFTLAAGASADPTIASLAWTDLNTTVNSAFGAAVYLQSQSKLRPTINSSAVQGATFVSKMVLFGTAQTPVLETQDITPPSSGSVPVTAQVTDSRGRTKTLTTTVTVVPYQTPRLNSFAVQRATAAGVVANDGTRLRFDLNAVASSVVVGGTEKNGLSVVVQTKISGSAQVTHPTYTYGIARNGFVVLPGTYPVDKSVEIQFTVSDKSQASPIKRTTKIATESIAMHISGNTVAIGKYKELAASVALEVGGEIHATDTIVTDGDIFSGGTTPDHKLVRYGDLPSSVPAGTIIEWPAAVVPTGWLLCDGQAVSRTTYSDLFAIIGVQYGTGNGSTTFNLPDLRGRVPVGFSSSETEFNSLGKKYGAKTHTLTIAQLASHSHAQNVTAPTGSGPGIRTSWTGDATSISYPQGISTDNTGGGQAHNNIQPSFAINFIIKVSGGIGEISNTVESVLLNRVATVETNTQMVSHYKFASAITVGTGWSVLSSSSYWQARGDTMTTPGWNNGIVIPRDGIYHIDATMLIPGVTAVLHLVLKLNDTGGSMSNSIGGNIANTNTTTSQVSVSTHYELKAGDVITLALYTATGGSKIINAQGTTFSARLVQPL